MSESRTRRRRSRFPEWPITLVLVGVVISLGVIATGHFRRGSVLLSAAILLGLFLRMLLSERDAGLLAVRSRLVDVITLAVLGVSLAALAFWVPAGG